MKNRDVVFELKLRCETDAFKPTPAHEVARILREAARRLESVTTDEAAVADWVAGGWEEMIARFQLGIMPVNGDRTLGEWPGHHQTAQDKDGRAVGYYRLTLGEDR